MSSALTDALHGDQVVVTLIRIPTHSDAEQGTSYHHEEVQEVKAKKPAGSAGLCGCARILRIFWVGLTIRAGGLLG